MGAKSAAIDPDIVASAPTDTCVEVSPGAAPFETVAVSGALAHEDRSVSAAASPIRRPADRLPRRAIALLCGQPALCIERTSRAPTQIGTSGTGRRLLRIPERHWCCALDATDQDLLGHREPQCPTLVREAPSHEGAA